MNALARLIAEARVLAGGEHECSALGHDWRSTGGRRCPRAPDGFEPNCSQTVYECRACGAVDYGEVGGPGHRECYVDGPCSHACRWALDEATADKPGGAP